MTRLTLNGINQKVEGFKELVETIVKNIHQEIREIKENEIKHMRGDIEDLKKFVWKVMGGLTVLVVIIEILARWVIK